MANSSGHDYDILLSHGDALLRQHGDSHLGAGWPREEDRYTRFDVMLDVMVAGVPKGRTVLCDLACGTGELLARIRERQLANIDYIGIDRSDMALGYAREKFPNDRFAKLDVNDPDSDLSLIDCDYLVADGLFTVKWELSYEQMWAFLELTMRRVWPHVRRGIAFNVMSKVVDWERDDLFHVPMDDLARLLFGLAGRHVMIRADYGLYEYTAYAFRDNPRIKLVAGRSPRAPGE
jgi:SAM-dependent methyltransferase